jgi:hypothetical protein
MLNKKTVVLAFAAIAASATALAGCDSVVAIPTSDVYDAEILNLDNVTHNAMSQIYDSVVSEGDTNSAKVLSNILYIYSQTMYGPFYDVKNSAGTVTANGLHSVVTAYLADSTSQTNIDAIQAFADNYAIYADDTTGEGSIDKVIAFYRDILYRVRAVFLTYVQNTTYQVRSVFYEKKFYDAQVKAYYSLGDVSSYKIKQVEGTLRVSENLDGDDDEVESGYFNDLFTTYENYIEDAVLPDIYRSELISQYLYSQNYRTIGNSYARKVDVITLGDNSAYPGATKALIRAYCKDVLAVSEADAAVTSLFDSSDKIDFDLYGFPFLGDLYKGTTSDFTADQKTVRDLVYADAGWTDETITVSGETITYQNESSMGTYYNQFAKLTDDRFTDNSSVRSDFTDSGAYSVETGLKIKQQALVATDKTTHGWYTSSGLTSLPSSSKTRLFKMGVANEVDYESNYATKDPEYGKFVNHSYYLTPESYETTDSYPYLTYSSSNWYLIRVDEAVKGAKLIVDGDGSYSEMTAHSSDSLFTEYIARQVAYTLSSNDTYKTASNKYFVDQMAITYHDTTIYDYFKTTFPDLFD